MIFDLTRITMVLLAACALWLLLFLATTYAEDRECSVPERFYAFEPELTKTVKALTAGREVIIATLGGASTVGVAAGGGGLAWPSRLASALAASFPSARVKVINLAVARQTAKRGAERLDSEVLPLKPNLLIWETGTMEAVRGTDLDAFRETVRAGIDELRAARVEVVLMNMQFSRETDTLIYFEPYLSAMRQLADANDVPLFHRHGIMRHWAESGVLDLRVKDGEKRRELAAKLYDCIGHAMADFVTRGGSTAKGAAKPGRDR
jgi:lysophospholipase L1-like esterase